MAVGRDVMGADGLTNAERYAKRLADKKARQAAFRAQQDAKKAAAAEQEALTVRQELERQFSAQDGLTFGGEPSPSAAAAETSNPLQQLYAQGNTRAQQQEQAASDFYGMSDGQRAALQGYYDKGIIDPETNLFTEEYLANAENNGNLYEMFTGGFGLGDNDLHRSLMSQAQAGWTAQKQAENPYDASANDGLTFGGGSNAGDYVETTPEYIPPPPPPPPAGNPGGMFGSLTEVINNTVRPPVDPTPPPVVEPPPPTTEPPPPTTETPPPPVTWEDPYQGVGPNAPLDDPENPPAGYEGGYDWNWDDFQPGAPSLDGGGGYDPNDYAFDRYVPGQESPWGIPEVEGGNKDFYRNQFVNLLRDEQNFRDRQRTADEVRQEAAENPLEAPPMDWSWLDGGLPEVRVGGSPDDWRMQEGYGDSASNDQTLTNLRTAGDISKSTYDWFKGNFQDNPQGGENNWWTANNDYRGLFESGQDPAGRAAYQDLAGGLFENFGNPEGVAAGYAAPVAGYDGSRRKQASGPSNFYYNPMTSQWVTGAGLPSGTTGGAGGSQSKK